ncbi:type I restriction endonuclease [Streptomyces brevispora]|uniref:Type I restriction endonuclease n=1 Tax=Streptomyces brevispora TaxID=887462 RepID=A0ABZ1G972_9ACTN|nr:type I restriction endonuclease [Streptomyces brevispora]WSC15695.1 type I restriction endonuclease [Streptomyces brevispora]
MQYIEWHEDRAALNDFTVVDQLRVKNRSGDVSILDVVLFVNGIPLVAAPPSSTGTAGRPDLGRGAPPVVGCPRRR